MWTSGTVAKIPLDLWRFWSQKLLCIKIAEWKETKKSARSTSQSRSVLGGRAARARGKAGRGGRLGRRPAGWRDAHRIPAAAAAPHACVNDCTAAAAFVLAIQSDSYTRTSTPAAYTYEARSGLQWHRIAVTTSDTGFVWWNWDCSDRDRIEVTTGDCYCCKWRIGLLFSDCHWTCHDSFLTKLRRKSSLPISLISDHISSYHCQNQRFAQRQCWGRRQERKQEEERSTEEWGRGRGDGWQGWQDQFSKDCKGTPGKTAAEEGGTWATGISSKPFCTEVASNHIRAGFAAA